ncbi:MAG: GNAT family N-acetyltransferase [Planctomycetota bacterium]
MVYKHSCNGVTPDQLEGFFVEWPAAPSVEEHLRLLQNSAKAIVAIDASTDRVVGFITAISDGVLAASIPLLEVLPGYQRQGIGAELMKRMLGLLDGLYMIDLQCDPELVPFYEAVGMKAGVGMRVRQSTAIR